MARKFILNPITGELDYIDEATVSGGGTYNVEKFTLSPSDITNKSVTLANTPSTANLTRLVVIEGIEQDYGVDFSVSGTLLTWNGLGLESLLESGDKLIIVYN